jgi:Uma2 family endonuclease
VIRDVANTAVVLDEDIRIPAAAHALAAFRAWSRSEEFPERGRIDYVEGDLEVDLSPEDLYTHGVVKAAIATELYALVTKAGLGNVFIDRTRVVAPAAGLSVEPDVVVVLWDALRAGRVREVPAAGGTAGRYVELEGAPDLVVEIVSDRSAAKDLGRLPRLYARAGVPELWLADARGEALRFEIRALQGAAYAVQPADGEGWIASPLLGRSFRLTRRLGELSRWAYDFESRST